MPPRRILTNGDASVVETLRVIAPILIAKGSESFAYFTQSLVLPLLLSSAFELSDSQAAALTATTSLSVPVFGALLAGAIDRAGPRASALAGATFAGLGRLLLAMSPSLTLYHAIVALVLLLPIGSALGMPVYTIALKRATVGKARTRAFGFFYATMNVGAAAAGFLANGVLSTSSTMGGDDDMSPDDGMLPTTPAPVQSIEATGSSFVGQLQLMLSVATAASLVTAAAGLTFPGAVPSDHRKDDDSEDEELRSETTMPSAPPTSWGLSSALTYLGLSEGMAIFRDPVFQRLTVYSLVMLFVNSVFRHMDSSLPKFMLRALGPAGSHFGLVYAINPIMIIALVPVVQHLLAGQDPYLVIMCGSAVSAVSALLIPASPVGMGGIISFVVVLSLGESVYSPRTYDFIMAMSPKGKEALYGALAMAPRFVVTMLVGWSSGLLLEGFCPQEGAEPERCLQLWLVVSLISCATPILLLVMKSYLYNDDVRKRIAEEGTVAH